MTTTPQDQLAPCPRIWIQGDPRDADAVVFTEKPRGESVEYVAAATPAHQAAKFRKALEEIRDGDSSCGCDHYQPYADRDLCCVAVGVFCPKCIAGRALAAQPPALEATLKFADAVAIARGCFDYGGGYRSNDEKLAIFHHGIQTVVNALEAAEKRGLKDTQVAVLHRLGAALEAQEGHEFAGGSFCHAGVGPDNLVCGEPRDAAIHQVKPQVSEAEAELKREGKV